MFIPYIRKGFLHWQDGKVKINDCTFGDLQLFLPLPKVYHEIEDEEGNLRFMFVCDIEIGEVTVLVDPAQDKVMSVVIELFDDMALEDFLRQQGYLAQKHYQFIDDGENSFIVFNKHFYARLSEDLDKVCCFIYSNRDFLTICETSLSRQILSLSDQLGQFN